MILSRRSLLMVIASLAFVGSAGCDNRGKEPEPASSAPAAATAPAPSEAPKATADSLPKLDGTYNVRGRNPGGGGGYSGSVVITSLGDENYRFDWRVGAIYSGVGKREGSSITVNWGDSKNMIGSVTYHIEADGRLTGSWYESARPNSLGSEILLPR